jgi:Helix-turn-helix domain
MDRPVEKLLYSRRDTADALSLSIRSIDYLITTGRLPARRVGGKILIPASAVRRFAREDHPDAVRSSRPSSSVPAGNGQSPSEESMRRFLPQSEGFDSRATFGAKG